MHLGSIPHYDVLSRKLEGRRMTVVVNYIRKFLIEDIYARLLVMFPETANWLGSPDEYVLRSASGISCD